MIKISMPATLEMKGNYWGFLLIKMGNIIKSD